MKPTLSLRDVSSTHLPVFFAHQTDPDSVYMAAFVFGNIEDRSAFDARWARLLSNPEVNLRTIVVRESPAGHIASFTMEGRREIAYWMGREYWGKGLATEALGQFLEIEETRPLFARAAGDNLASCRVLEKCGFRRIGTERSHAPARDSVIEERVFQRD